MILANYLLNVYRANYLFNAIQRAAVERCYGSSNIYLYTCVTQLTPVCATCLCLSMFDIKSEY